MRTRNEYPPMSDQEWARMTCEHEFGDTWTATFLGCVRSCTKCGLKQCDPNHCGQYDASMRRRSERGDKERGR